MHRLTVHVLAPTAFVLAALTTLVAEEPRWKSGPSATMATDCQELRGGNVPSAPKVRQGFGAQIFTISPTRRFFHGHVIHSCFWDEA
jgi:hypothetical protein